MNFLKNNKIFKIPTYNFILYFVAVIVILFFLYSIKVEIETGYKFSQEAIQNFIKEAGYLSWLAYIIILSLFVMSPLPSTALGILAGYLFHPIAAVFFGLIGETIGAAGNYYIGSKFGKVLCDEKRFPRISRIIAVYGKKLDQEMIFLLGLIPVSTANVTAYAAAMSGMSFKKYIIPWFSGVGIVVILASLLGYSAQIQSKYLFVIVAAIILLYFGIKYIYKKYMN